MASFKEKLLKTVFTVEEGTETKKQVPQQEKTQTFIPEGWSGSLSQNVSLKPELTSKYKQHFLDVMKDTNIQGPDYYELDEMIDKMEAQIPDRKQRMFAAYTALSLQGLTKEKVKSSVEAYIAALDADEKGFMNQLNEERRVKVSLKEDSIKNCASEIEKLNTKILELNKNIEQLQREVKEETVRLDENAKTYSMELNEKKNKIKNDIFEFEKTIN